MPATPARVALSLNDGVLLSRADPAIKADHPNAVAEENEVESFFDTAEDAEVMLGERWDWRSRVGGLREQIEVDSSLNLGTTVPITPAAPQVKITDEDRGIIGQNCIVRAYAVDYTSERYAIELSPGFVTLMSSSAVWIEFDDGSYWAAGEDFSSDGPNLIRDGDGEGVSAWAGPATLSLQNGRLRVDANGAGHMVSQGFPTVVGQRYRATAEHYNVSAEIVRMRLGSTDGDLNLGYTGEQSGVASVEFVAITPTTYVTLQPQGGGAADFDNIEVRKIAGIKNMPGYTFSRAGARGEFVSNPPAPRVKDTELLGTADAWQSAGAAVTTFNSITASALINATPYKGAPIALAGKLLRVTLDAVISGGGAVLTSLSNGAVRGITPGHNDFYVVWPAGANSNVGFQLNNFVGSLTNISMREFDTLIDYFGDNQPAVVPGRGLISRPAMTNRTPNSNDLTAWTQANCTITPNAFVAPDGTLTGDLVVSTAGGTGAAQAYGNTTLNTDQYFTTSCFIPKGVGTAAFAHLQMNTPLGNAYGMNVDVATGAMSNNDLVAAADKYVVDCGAFWRAVMIYGTNANGAGVLHFGPADAANSRVSATGKSVGGWGFQTLLGVHYDGGPIIATAGAEVAVEGDDVTISNPIQTDQDFLFYATVDLSAHRSTYEMFAMLGANYPVAFYFQRDANDATVQMVVGEAVYVGPQVVGAKRLTVMGRRRAGKNTFAYKADGTATVQVESAATVWPTIDGLLRLGHYGNGDFQMNGAIEDVKILLGTFDDADMLAFLEDA